MHGNIEFACGNVSLQDLWGWDGDMNSSCGDRVGMVRIYAWIGWE